MNAQKLTDQALKSIAKGGKFTTDLNFQSSNSDISFIWTFYLLGFTDLWHVTKDQRIVDVCNASIDWLFSVADSNQDANFKADVITSWGPKKIEKLGLNGGKNYEVAPSNSVNPGWSRFIDVGGGKMGFRPEILASGVVGYAVACYIRDLGDTLDKGRRDKWLKHLAEIFQYHAPNWRDSEKHSAGATLSRGANDGVEVAGYFWPKDKAGGIWATMPGLNQQSQFLTMGLIVESLLGADIGAMDKAKKFCEKTIPHLIREDGDCMVTAYDLRDHSKMGKDMQEPVNDSTHSQHSMPIFEVGPELGLLPVSYQRQLINQVMKHTSLGGGRMGVLMDGTCDHGGANGNKYHPGIAHIADCLFFENGKDILPLAKEVLAYDAEHHGIDTYSHKGFHYNARVLRAEALYSGQIATPAAAKSAGLPESQPEKEAATCAPGACSGDAIKVGFKGVLPGTEAAGRFGGFNGPDDVVSVTGVWKGVKIQALKPGKTQIKTDVGNFDVEVV